MGCMPSSPSEFGRDIRAGDVFVFLNRRLDRIKLIHWDHDGLAIWMKRLERGTFQRPRLLRRRPRRWRWTRPTWRCCSRGSS